MDLIIVGGVFVLVAIAVSFVSTKLAKKRAKEFKELAEKLNYKYSNTNQNKLMNYIEKFFICSVGKIKAIYQVMSFIENEVEIDVFDYAAKTEEMGTIKQTIILFQSRYTNFENFIIYPSKIKLSKDIKTEMKPLMIDIEGEFHNFFKVEGLNRDKIIDYFDDEFYNFFLANKNIVMEGVGQGLIIYDYNKEIPVNELEDFINKSKNIFFHIENIEKEEIDY